MAIFRLTRNMHFPINVFQQRNWVIFYPSFLHSRQKESHYKRTLELNDKRREKSDTLLTVQFPIFSRKGDTAECKFLFHFHNLTVLNYSFVVANVPAIYFSARLFHSGYLNYIHFVTACHLKQPDYLNPAKRTTNREEWNTCDRITVFRRYSLSNENALQNSTGHRNSNGMQSALLFSKQLLSLLINSIIIFAKCTHLNVMWVQRYTWKCSKFCPTLFVIIGVWQYNEGESAQLN